MAVWEKTSPAARRKTEIILEKATAKNDQKQLAKLAMECSFIDLREAAIKQLTDQKLIADIARNDPLWRARATAVEKLADRELLTELAKKDADKPVRRAAIQRLTEAVKMLPDPMLADAAKYADIIEVRITATQLLKNQAVLADLAKNDASWYVRKAAIEQLKDPAILADLAKNNRDELVRDRAVDLLTDRAALADVAKNGSDDLTRLEACVRMLSLPGNGNDLPEEKMCAIAEECVIAKINSTEKKTDTRAEEAIKQIIDSLFRYQGVGFSRMREYMISEDPGKTHTDGLGPHEDSGNSSCNSHWDTNHADAFSYSHPQGKLLEKLKPYIIGKG